MLNIAITALCLLLAKRQCRTPRTVPTPAIMKAPTDSVIPSASEEPVATLDAYQDLIARQTLFAPPPTVEYKHADLFINQYLRAPYVHHVSQFVSAPDDLHYVQTFTKRFITVTGSHLWRICAINTSGGCIYLSLQLNDDFSIPTNTAGVLVTYDAGSVSSMILHTSSEQINRFGQVVFQLEPVIRSEKALRFLLGDSLHPHAISHYFTSGEI